MGELQDIIVAGEQVEAMMATNGWVNCVEPLLDKMIRDVLGGKDNGRWDNGAFDEKNQTDFEIKQLLAYKTALVNFHSGVMQFVDDAQGAREQLKAQVEDNKYQSDYEPEVYDG